MRKLSIVIITHNNYKLKCGSIETVLLALENQTTADFDVLIVDNNSDIDDYLILKSFLKTQFFSFELHVIRNNCNSIAMLVLSMFFGRAWCGYLCPAGGLQECLFMCNPKPAKQRWRNNIKYVIWVVWIIAVIITFILGKNDVTIDPFYMTDHGISVADIYNYVIYYGVILILVLPALIHGRRASCHYICWMAPFMIIGSTVGRWLRLPQLHIDADKDVCISCGKCNMSCPMGLNVKVMVLEGNNAKCTECIQCGACIDACPKKVLKYKLRWRQ